jgi:hypothetical protein
VSYFTLRTIIFLMETMKDFYSSTTIPPSAAVATRRCDLRVNEYVPSNGRAGRPKNNNGLLKPFRDGHHIGRGQSLTNSHPQCP